MPIDYTKYPKNWKSEIVPRILAREENCCKFCEVENGALLWSIPLRIRHDGLYKIKRIWVRCASDMTRLKHLADGGEIKTIAVVLTVAHLDHDETNHNVADDRLAALCQYCHLNYDAKEKFRRAFEGP